VCEFLLVDERKRPHLAVAAAALRRLIGVAASEGPWRLQNGGYRPSGN
jgi:hypothetical protein